MKKFTILLALFSIAMFSSAMAQDLFFSEYMEGSSNNKALEIYNPTDAAVDLSTYQIFQTANGSTPGQWEFFHTFPEGAMIEPGDVWVIVTDQAFPEMQAVADEVLGFPSVVHHNGDDARGLATVVGTDTTLLDIIGETGEDPGSGWDVAGVTNATQNHTLKRKSSVMTGTTDWAAAAGTNAEDSEWEVLDQDVYSYLGKHKEVWVTFRANTSTVQGFTDSTSTLQVRGGIDDAQGGDGPWDQSVLVWSDQSVAMMHTGGDYWKTTVAVPDSFIGRALNWKLGATLIDENGFPSDFWENGDNRVWIVEDKDTTLSLAYVSNGFNPPYTPSDSVDVLFRVNMGNNPEFDSDAGSVYIVGNFPGPDGADNMWVPDKYKLTREGDSDYWSFHLKLDMAKGPWDSTMYRFTVGEWGTSENVRGHGMFPDNENRGVSVGLNDTTISWKWWNDIPPAPFSGTDDIVITFTTDLTQAILNNGFTAGDTVIVRSGWNSTAKEVFNTSPMQKSGFGNTYAVTDTIVSEVGLNLEYNYYIIKGGVEYREIFFDFTDPESGSSAEKRKVELTGTTLSVTDNSSDPTSLRRQPNFRNLDKLSQNVSVTFEVDLRPAYFQTLAGDTLSDIQGPWDVVNPDSVMAWGVRMNGPATGGWGSWGLTLFNDTSRTLFDDGTHGDVVAGDSIFTRQYSYTTEDVKGQEFKFGVRGGDNEGGFGNNHIENIDDSSPEAVIRAQFGSIDPLFYSAWDFENGRRVTGLENEEFTAEIKTFKLNQNYPNPFNPATSISFSIPKSDNVKLEIFNVIGQKVRTLINGKLAAGVYTQVWSGKDGYGSQAASGVYFYKLSTENGYSSVKKMIMMK